MKDWFTSNELLGFEGMPNSVIGISQKAKRNSWIRRKASGKGRALEYHISNFHPDVKKQLIEKYITDSEEAVLLFSLHAPFNYSELDNEEVVEREINESKQVYPNEAGSSNVSKITPMTEVKDWCELPVFDVHAAAGAGSLVHSEYQIDRLILPTSLLSEFGLSPNTASIIYVNGDSMEPTLSDGDRLLVDIREQQHPVVNGVYVIRIDDAVYVKRLRWDIPKGIYEVISDNVAVQAPFEIDHNNGRNFKIIGKAVAPVFKKIF